ncbi:ribonuclease BN [Legionella beliardensis]|uniref:Ribonuclease BN n=1 Tax=Legionella beliardensis TaxID=91822 RepID=A0A378I0G4_9GAMM|nr:YihY/virulence factor BrkB family protein [Legionella beliardensis]STX28483.1 ribonuclease BN [Legionella beliardensis]
MDIRNVWQSIKELVKLWRIDRVSSLSAALAFYTVFSLAPILLICIVLIGFFLGEAAAQGRILEHASDLVGAKAALQIQTMIENSQQAGKSRMPQLIGIALLIFGTTRVFAELQNGLNRIWGVMPKPGRGLLNVIKDRFLSFSMVLGIALLLLVSMVLSVALAAMSSFLIEMFGGNVYFFMRLEYVVSFLIITVLFAMLFKILPDVILDWKDVWIGAFITAILFSLGKFIVSYYINNSGRISIFGAASSVIIILIWFYFSSQILFIGVEINKLLVLKKGKTIKPKESAMLVDENRTNLENIS